MSGIKLPTAWQKDPLASPPTVFRGWAGKYGAKRGLTAFLRHDRHGRPTYRNNDFQDAFRHAFVFGAKYLDWISRPHLPAMDTEEAAVIQTLQAGYLNEWFASNSLEQHLKDYWNNYEGILLAREAHKIYGDKITNDLFADFVAQHVWKSESAPLGTGRLILDADKDPRAHDTAGYDVKRLPPHGTRPEIVEQTFKVGSKANNRQVQKATPITKGGAEFGTAQKQKLGLDPTVHRLLSGDLSALDPENGPFSPNLLRLLMGGKVPRVKGATRLEDIAKQPSNRFGQ